ncbi:zinc-binding dehydrogenase [Candidatus Poribacteria bacterium]|nr:zinc-binding dehydrogenase [Candidatus Poribacteria bacterium]
MKAIVYTKYGSPDVLQIKKLLKPGGVYISSDLGYMAQNTYLPLITPVIKPLLGNKKTAFPFSADIPGSLRLVKKLTEEGKFKAVIDRKYPLERIVQAYKYVETGQKTGNVVIIVEHNEN